MIALAIALWFGPAGAAAAVADGNLSGADADRERTMGGYIDGHTLADISRWLRANPHRDLTLHVNSGGGLAFFGASIFDAIRAHGQVATDVGSGQFCLSACAYVWLAGRTRSIAARAELGFHSAYCVTACDPRVAGVINQSILDILARTEPSLAVLVSRSGAMITGNHLITLARWDDGHWSVRTVDPPER